MMSYDSELILQYPRLCRSSDVLTCGACSARLNFYGVIMVLRFSDFSSERLLETFAKKKNVACRHI